MTLAIAVAPSALVFAGALFALVFDALGWRKTAVGAVVISCGAASGVGVWTGLSFDSRPVPDLPSLFATGGAFSNTAGIVYALAALSVLGGARRLAATDNGGQLASLTAFCAAAAGVLLAAVDLLALVVALEAVALSGYALVAGGRARRSDEAAMKYFIQGAVATGLLVYAVAILFGMYGGNLVLPEIGFSVDRLGGRAALTALALLLAAFAFKLGAFPFHSWAPDAYETAPPSMAGFLATGPKLAVLLSAFVVFPVMVFRGLAFAQPAALLFAALAVASILFGNLGGLKQLSYTRMLAYSGIAQVGYALVAFAALFGVPATDPRDAFPVLLFGVVYALAAVGAFLGAEAVRSADESWDGSVAGMAGLGRSRPALAAALTACLLSLTGIPLTAGFWGKFEVFASAVGGDWQSLAVIGVLGSVVSFGYYGSVIKAMYLDDSVARVREPADEADGTGSIDRLAEGTVMAAAIAVLVIGVVPFFTGLGLLERLLSLAM